MVGRDRPESGASAATGPTSNTEPPDAASNASAVPLVAGTKRLFRQEKSQLSELDDGTGTRPVRQSQKQMTASDNETELDHSLVAIKKRLNETAAKTKAGQPPSPKRQKNDRCEYNYVSSEEEGALDTVNLDRPPDINISEEALLVALRNDPNFVVTQTDVIGAICMLCKTSYLDRYGCMKHFRSRDGHKDLMAKLDNIALQNHRQKVTEGQAKAEDGTRAKPQLLIDHGFMRVNLINPARYRRISDCTMGDVDHAKTKEWIATMISTVHEQATMISTWLHVDPRLLQTQFAVSLVERVPDHFTDCLKSQMTKDFVMRLACDLIDHFLPDLDDLPKANRLVQLLKPPHSEADISVSVRSVTENLDPTEYQQRCEASMVFLDEMSTLLPCRDYMAASTENVQAAQECLRKFQGPLHEQFFYEMWRNRVDEILSSRGEIIAGDGAQETPPESGSPGKEGPDPTSDQPVACSEPCVLEPVLIPSLPNKNIILDETQERNDELSVECSKPDVSEEAQKAPDTDNEESSAETSDQISIESASAQQMSTEPLLVRLKRRSRKTMVDIANQALPKRVKPKTPTATILRMVEHDGDLDKVAQLLEERTRIDI